MMTSRPLARSELGGRTWWQSSWKSTAKSIFANMHSSYNMGNFIEADRGIFASLTVAIGVFDLFTKRTSKT